MEKAELTWNLGYDGYKGIIGIENAPDVTDAIERGESSGYIGENEWRIQITIDGERIPLGIIQSKIRSTIADSVAKKIIEQSKQVEERVEKVKQAAMCR